MYKELPPTKHPNIIAIFEKLYLIYMPEMYLRTEEDIRARGTTTTGDPELDMVTQNTMVRAYRTINQMFELYKQGVPLSVAKYEDTELIYHAIENHLKTWFNHIQMDFQLHLCPLAELIELDKFANIIYDKAKFVFTDQALDMIQGASNGLGIDIRPGSFFGKVGRYKTPVFTHMYKSEREKFLEASPMNKTYIERKGYEKDMVNLAMRYDIPLENQPKEEVKSLGFELKFANDQ